MKKAMLVFFFIGVFSFFSHLPCFAQDPLDPGEPDTVRFLDWGYYVICPPCTGRAVVPVVIVNDDYVQGMFIPLKWTGSIKVDTFLFAGERSEFIAGIGYEVDNTEKHVYLQPVALPGDPIPAGNGIMFYLYFTVEDTGLVTLDLDTPSIGIGFHFVNLAGEVYSPHFIPSEFYIGEQSTLPGDVNLDGNSSVSDVVFLINYLFKSGPPPVHLPSGDVNLDCQISMSDVIHFINYLFKSGSCLEMGCCYPD